MAKGILKKIIAAVIGIAIGTAAVVIYITVSNKNSNPDLGEEYATRIVALPAPQNLSFDKESYTLSWDKVEYATGYTVFYNGSIIGVEAEQTSERIMLTSESNSFKVKALGDNIDYSESAWSQEISYTVEKGEEQSVFDKVNIALNKTAKENNLELVKVIGISYVNVEGSGAGINLGFETVCLQNGVEKNIQLDYGFTNYDNIFDMISNIENHSKSHMSEKSIVNFKSAEALVVSGSYDGQMKELADQGYTISVVESCVREGTKIGSRFRFEIVGTYKAERGSDVKYFTSINRIELNQVSTKASTNYEQSVVMGSERTVTETSFVMHEATLEYIENLDTKANTSASEK